MSLFWPKHQPKMQALRPYFFQEEEQAIDTGISSVQSTVNYMLKSNFLEHNRNQSAGDGFLAHSVIPLFNKYFM